ncbi:hypothetical protein [Eubacterium sp.]|uniref:hypothetical protein n=1 Tax=Eubacterium sp. TaxID=142586 RepID=UPI0026E09B03|nr:hypothetical protein [Eubacterium sp.]MDO5433840.1 hypothetical protein [Eubacterium sp.]
MQLTITNRRIDLAYTTALAVQYDNGTEFVDFVLDRTQYDEDLSDLTPLFLYENAAGGFIDTATKTVTADQIIVRWLIGKHLTNVAGELSFMLVLADCEDITKWQDATRIWQTEKARCTIPPSILATKPFDPEAPLISQLIALAVQINETIGSADQILQDMTKIKDDAQAIVDNFTAEDVVFTDGQTFQQKYEAGDLDGPPGEQGKEGAGLAILGTLESTAELPVAGEPGQAYMIGGNLYVWTLSDSTWINVGKIKGDAGDTPEIGANGNWWISGVDTGVPATGEQGDTPVIGENGHWFIGGTDTGLPSRGATGPAPAIGENGNWTIDNVDTGVKAAGHTPIITVGENGHWFVDGVDTLTQAQGDPGPPGEGVAEMQAALETKQNSTDDTLQTNAKTIVGAINELQIAYNIDLTDFINIMNGTGGTAS